MEWFVDKFVEKKSWKTFGKVVKWIPTSISSSWKYFWKNFGVYSEGILGKNLCRTPRENSQMNSCINCFSGNIRNSWSNSWWNFSRCFRTNWWNRIFLGVSGGILCWIHQTISAEILEVILWRVFWEISRSVFLEDLRELCLEIFVDVFLVLLYI